MLKASEGMLNSVGTGAQFHRIQCSFFAVLFTKEPMPKIYIWCGTEDFLYAQNVTMKEHLESLDYDLTYEESAGDHQWYYWDAQIQRVLQWLPLEK